MTTATTYTPSYTVSEIADEAIRLTNCVNGNPRYYISAMMFRRDGEFFRPKFCRKYTGRINVFSNDCLYGAGWVFTSYNLETSIRQAIEVAA